MARLHDYLLYHKKLLPKDNDILGRVVQKAIYTNPGLKVKWTEI